MASTKTPSSKTAGSNGAGRLPSTRERRPALAALAVLLIVGGALASAWLAVRAGHRAEFVQVQAEVGQGQKIEQSDLTTVELPEDFDGGVPEDESDELVGEYAATPWTKGMVVTESMVTGKTPLESGMQIFPVPLKPGQAEQMSAGTPVALYTGADSGVAGTLTDDPEVATDSSTSSEETTVSVEVSATCGSEVAGAIQNDEITVAQDSPDIEAREEC